MATRSPTTPLPAVPALLDSDEDVGGSDHEESDHKDKEARVAGEKKKEGKAGGKGEGKNEAKKMGAAIKDNKVLMTLMMKMIQQSHQRALGGHSGCYHVEPEANECFQHGRFAGVHRRIIEIQLGHRRCLSVGPSLASTGVRSNIALAGGGATLIR